MSPTDIQCPYCDATRPRPDTQSCGCGATVFDKPNDPTHKGQDFSDTVNMGTSFAGQDLRNADFRDAVLQGCDFRRADLRGAKFNDAVMQGCDLRGAQTGGASFKDAVMQGVRR